ncbi:asparagine synthase (glutamine-hydrolyzing) [Candidatus Puniceispirillum marinum]|uniref:asparagine synthase (glutamine-hydrolyzing) n=1 Tax=Puniceispirillum marinum (strain IMCC1322) TaxID=488538 RepID=D5BN12_PUNMI|nr:asparagine synthase (glutamine-hydrolyzing) [Candidatus Puniceispirillum marinum]ADE40205.1 asparagine synthetase [Candidatus Puniceispirillum marinum IMCC1322]
MCGIAGFFDQKGFDATAGTQLAKDMAKAIIHRGPDDAGVWVDDAAGIALAHRRLSIVDLSAAGHQPMLSASGRYVLAYNGEIYNHTELRNALEASGKGYDWRGHSDTETALACIEAYGLEAALQQFVGMFALALWDKQEKALYLARDRIGEKPLYFGRHNNIWLFGSELKALRVHHEFTSAINRDALCLYLRHNYIPAPYSIYDGIGKLPPGSYVRLDAHTIDAAPVPFWTLDDKVSNGKANAFDGSEAEALDHLDKVLSRAVRLQMQADVPLGAFLSGGVDSSLIVALMAEQSERKVKSFSIGFEDAQFDEAPFARDVANHIGTDHHELYVTAQETLDVIPKLPMLYDEPFSDSSQIPTFLVSQIARQHVTVSLSGDAGDELFGGYNRYTWGRSIWNKMNKVPHPLRSAMGTGIGMLSPKAWNAIMVPLMNMVPQKYQQKNPGDKLHKAAGMFSAKAPEDIYKYLVSHWPDPAAIVLGGTEPQTTLTSSHDVMDDMPFEARMMYLDMLSYLPDDILVKVDRAAMGVSLETRVPFLDHNVVEAAWQLPMNMKIRNGTGKWCLRELLYRRVPKHLIERPKMGFGVPLDAWLRGPLRDWAEHLLDEKRLAQAGFFDPAPIRKKWDEHLSGARSWHYYIWDILMFEAWRDEQGGCG